MKLRVQTMENKDVLVSVVMPVYNDESFIKDTILSVLNQTHSNLELIIVEDCSKDNSLEAIRNFDDKRIKLFRNPENRGAAYSRNFAIKQSKGDYIAFLDGDDLWEKDKLEKHLAFMISNNYDFSYTNYFIIDDDGNNTCIYYTGPKKITHLKFMRMNYVGCLTAMYKKNIYPDLEIPNDIARRNDYALWLKISERCDCYLLNENLAKYRQRKSGSITTSNKNSLFSYHFKLFNSLYDYGVLKCKYIFYRGVIYSILKKILYKKHTK